MGGGWCRGGAEWYRGGTGLVQGWSGVVWVSLGVTVTIIDVTWVTQALCSDGVGLEGVGCALPSSKAL